MKMSNICRVLCLTLIILSFFANCKSSYRRSLTTSQRKRMLILHRVLSKYLEGLGPRERNSGVAADVEKLAQFLQNVVERPAEPRGGTSNYVWSGLASLSRFVINLLTSPSLINMFQPAINMMSSALAPTIVENRSCTCSPEACKNFTNFEPTKMVTLQSGPIISTQQPTTALPQNAYEVSCSRLQPVSKLNPYKLTGTWVIPSAIFYLERLALDNSTDTHDKIKSAIVQLNKPFMQSVVCLRTEIAVHNWNECEVNIDAFALGTKVESMKYKGYSPSGNGRLNYTHVSGIKIKMIDELVVLDVNPDEHVAMAACSGGVAVGAVILARKNTLPATSHEYIWDNILRQMGNHPSDKKRIWRKLGTKCVT